MRYIAYMTKTIAYILVLYCEYVYLILTLWLGDKIKAPFKILSSKFRAP